MIAQDYRSATDEQRSLILSQAEARMSDQHAFASAADARAATVTGAAAALATAAVGAFAASLSGGDINWSLACGGLAGTAGFAYAAHKALHSCKVRSFHPKGYRPRDFEDDIRSGKSVADIQSEMAEDLDERLDYNSDILSERGDLMDGAMQLLWLTPWLVAGAAVLGAGIDLLSRAGT